MYEQARSQWDSQFGEVLGEYPFVAGKQQAPDVQRQSAASALERYFPGGVEDDVTQAYLEMSGPEKLAFRMEAEKTLAANEKYKVDAEIKQKEAERQATLDTYKQQQDIAAKEASNSLDIHNQHQAFELKRWESQLTLAEAQVKSALKSIDDESFGEEPIEGRMEDLQKRLDAAQARYDQILAQEPKVNMLGGGGQPGQELRRKGDPTQQSSGPVQISTAADYNALPSGTEYIDPNGVRRRKP
jgi:hypothetical protein